MRNRSNDSRARRSLRQFELDQVQRVVMLRFAPMTSQPLAGPPSTHQLYRDTACRRNEVRILLHGAEIMVQR